MIIKEHKGKRDKNKNKRISLDMRPNNNWINEWIYIVNPFSINIIIKVSKDFFFEKTTDIIIIDLIIIYNF